MNAAQARGGAPIEFWFDFASGYAYFAALEIEAFAERHGRTVLWRPLTLGAAFKITGAQGLSRTPPRCGDCGAGFTSANDKCCFANESLSRPWHAIPLN
jgi:2-hydroxychromene-2-carboxylate isomerase